MSLLDDLYQPLAEGDLRLDLVHEGHRAGLRAACNVDTEIWALYPFSFFGEHFDAAFDGFCSGVGRLGYVIQLNDEIVGMTAWHDCSESKQTTYIGNSYLVPLLRGSGLNRRIKTLMIDHAVALGFRRIGLTVDARNVRSQRAVEKIGGVREGVLRAERITWTGHVRDTVVFSILADEWRAQQLGVGV